MKNYSNLVSQIPEYVTHVTSRLEEGGFDAYLVGGCVRDLLLDKEPKDWDITTNAKPEEIIALFEKTIYENTFGTVGVCLPAEVLAKEGLPAQAGVPPFGTQDVSHETSKGDVPRETPEYDIVEVTPYRTEAKYSDFRHPDEVKFSDKLEDDLKRRDFTINAMTLDSKGQVLDFYDGLKDIEDKTIRTVGDADERLTEDPLRMLRAVRFSCQLDFSISTETTESILKNADLIKKISTERIRDEFVKIINSPNPARGVLLLQKFNLLKHIIPELEEGINCDQGGAHIYDVWNHLLMALQHAADKDWPLEIRLSALFHDIGKPRTRRPGEKKAYTFYGHEVIGARMTKKIMERLKFSRKEIDAVETFVRMHMFFSDTEKITLSAVRRIIAKVGPTDAEALAGKKENHPIWNLMRVRECDRVGMAKKEAPYRLRKYFAMIEEALRDPISVGALKVDGAYMIKELGIKPGPRMGWILNALLEEVLEDPKKNTLEKLTSMIQELNKLSDKELKTLGDKGKEKKEELEEKEIEKLHKKHGV